MIDATEVERAVIGKLAGDAALAALLPDGVYWDLARQGATAFAIVSLSSSRREGELREGESFRTFVYIVKAVALGADADPIAAAETRMHALLHAGTLDLPAAAGCALMTMQWIDRIRYTETIAAETWQHRGARYEVTVTPTT